ncbi:MAG: 2-polyprenyl-6-hydroxyphenyl methylase/3-demethylubiquinone-9 3-methyltransferase [Parasphingorhabdus sp.]|jgi:2-polyprenyl-6-hydroxyphenyl methylase/3-demethylubiquinone-9 3-methyltransferase
MTTTLNVDPAEIEKFESLASRWWDPDSEFKPLHDMNPVRLDYINDRANLQASNAVDIGCGGGILSEAMCRAGAAVTGVDMGTTPLMIARLHAQDNNLDINYRQCTAEELAIEKPGKYDVVTCMEMLEHVPDPAAIVQACSQLLRPGGEVFFSTINRNAKAWLMAIVGAEYILNLLPKGTHHYKNLIRPSELASWARHSGLIIKDITGIHYNPFTKGFKIGAGVDINYIVHAKRPD